MAGNGDGDLNPSKLMVLDLDFLRLELGEDITSRVLFLFGEVIVV